MTGQYYVRTLVQGMHDIRVKVKLVAPKPFSGKRFAFGWTIGGFSASDIKTESFAVMNASKEKDFYAWKYAVAISNSSLKRITSGRRQQYLILPKEKTYWSYEDKEPKINGNVLEYEASRQFPLPERKNQRELKLGAKREWATFIKDYRGKNIYSSIMMIELDSAGCKEHEHQDQTSGACVNKCKEEYRWDNLKKECKSTLKAACLKQKCDNGHERRWTKEGICDCKGPLVNAHIAHNKLKQQVFSLKQRIIEIKGKLNEEKRKKQKDVPNRINCEGDRCKCTLYEIWDKKTRLCTARNYCGIGCSNDKVLHPSFHCKCVDFLADYIPTKYLSEREKKGCGFYSYFNWEVGKCVSYDFCPEWNHCVAGMVWSEVTCNCVREIYSNEYVAVVATHLVKKKVATKAKKSLKRVKKQLLRK